jgi:hypothetical protein
MNKRYIVTKKPLIKTWKAMLLIIIVVILVIFGANKIIKEFQKEQSNVPVLYATNDSGDIIATFIPVSYSWKYDGEEKNYNINKNYKTMDYSSENTVYLNGASDSFKIKTNSNYKMIKKEIKNYGILNDEMNLISEASSDLDYKIKADVSPYANPGESVTEVTIYYAKQGWCTYAIKTCNFEKSDAEIAKEYVGTNLKDKEKISELLSKLRLHKFFKNVSINGTNITIEYEYYPSINSDTININDLILFSCIENLETITYTSKNKKTSYYDDDLEMTEAEEFNKCVTTKEEALSNMNTTIENYLDFLKKEV